MTFRETEARLVCMACAGDAPDGKCANLKCIGVPIVEEVVDVMTTPHRETEPEAVARDEGAPHRRSADTEGTGQISPESAPAPEPDLDLLLLLQAAQALEDISRMPPITGMDQTFTRKCGRVAAGLRQRIGREK